MLALLENVAICVTPSGFRLPAETHPWGWHPRLLHATPPAFRSAPTAVPFVGFVNVRCRCRADLTTYRQSGRC
jgi:hypothetical protein